VVEEGDELVVAPVAAVVAAVGEHDAEGATEVGTKGSAFAGLSC
jgi:hypothetical protein